MSNAAKWPKFLPICVWFKRRAKRRLGSIRSSILSAIRHWWKFADLAKAHSKCPSGSEGGELGEFRPGQMVPEFDKVVFSAPVGVVQGPVKTQFGYHLVEVTSRTD